jgi:hypothetical protein
LLSTRLAAKRQEMAKQTAVKLVAENSATQSPALENAGSEKLVDAKSPAATPPAPGPENPIRENFFREAKVHYTAAITADIGFVERLGWFWSNHFCVNADVTVMAGGYAGGDPATCAWKVRRLAARRRGSSGNAGLSGQCELDRARLRRRHQPLSRALSTVSSG